jgi:hypothetical protein
LPAEAATSSNSSRSSSGSAPSARPLAVLETRARPSTLDDGAGSRRLV